MANTAELAMTAYIIPCTIMSLRNQPGTAVKAPTALMSYRGTAIDRQSLKSPGIRNT